MRKGDKTNHHQKEKKKAYEKRLEAQKEANKKRLEEEKRAAEKLLNEAKEIAEKAKEENENRSKTDLERLEEKYLYEKALLEKQKIDTLDLEIKFLNDKNDILLAQQAKEQEARDKQREIDEAKQREIDQKEIDDAKALEEAKQAVRETGLNNVSNIGKQLQTLAGKNKEVAKRNNYRCRFNTKRYTVLL